MGALLLGVWVVVALHASDSSWHKLGLFAGGNLNIHSADFSKLPGVPNCCPRFESGNGGGFNAGALYEHRLSERFWLGVRGGVLVLDGTLTRQETTVVHLLSGPRPGVFEHRMTARVMNAGIEPSVLFNPAGSMLLSFGVRVGANVVRQYEQVETIVEPKDAATFLDSAGNDTGMRTRNHYSGELPNAGGMQAHLVGGISYELPLTAAATLRLVPELQFYVPLTELSSGTRWKAAALRFGLALKYAPAPKPRRFERKYHIDTLRIPTTTVATATLRAGAETVRRTTTEEADAIVDREIIERTDTLLVPLSARLDASVAVVGVDSAGAEVERPRFTIEEVASYRVLPLLPYVFFDESSAELPARYRRLRPEEVASFRIEQLFEDSTLQIYHNLLNIVGKRLAERPEARLTIIGCNADWGAEKGNLELSRRRAEAVKEYLVRVWKIAEQRIEIQARNLPHAASTPVSDPDKAAENRRVELVSSDEAILAPLFLERVERVVSPRVLRFKLRVHADAGIDRWQLRAYQPSDMQRSFEVSGTGTPPPSVDWELRRVQAMMPRAAEPIVAELKLEDSLGNRTVARAETEPVDVVTLQQKRTRRVGEYELERYSLILFDFDKATIEGRNQRIVELIKQRLKPHSEIEIIGYTDRTGTAEYNKRLSERRAQAVKEALGRADATAVGMGQEQLLYTNELPEGRFYCRTVEVLVRTKVE